MISNRELFVWMRITNQRVAKGNGFVMICLNPSPAIQEMG